MDAHREEKSERAQANLWWRRGVGKAIILCLSDPLLQWLHSLSLQLVVLCQLLLMSMWTVPSSALEMMPNAGSP